VLSLFDETGERWIGVERDNSTATDGDAVQRLESARS
jgi:hypothetical protein